MADWNKFGVIATIVFGVINTLVGIASLILMWLGLNRSLPIALWMPLLISGTVIIGAALFYRVLRLLQRGQSSNIAGPDPIDNWLTRLADNQDRYIESYIHFPQKYPVIKRLETSDSETFADVAVEVINASVFDLRADKVEGRVRWDSNEFQRELELIDDPVIRHGQPKTLVLRQPIKPIELSQMRTAGRKIVLGTDGLTIHFRYANGRSAEKSARKLVPSDNTRQAWPVP